MLRLAAGSLLFALGCALAFPQSAQTPSSAPGSGEALFAQGNYAAAEEAFSRELRGPAPRPVTFFNRALARIRLQKPAAAKRDLDMFLVLAPRAAAGWSLRAALELQLDNPRAAASDADAALALDARDEETLLTRARARAALGHDDLAAEDFARLMPADTASPSALLARGDWHAARHRLQLALADYSLAAQLAPADPDTHFKLGSARFRALDFSPAVVSLQQAAKLAPQAGPVHRATGLAHYAEGDFPAAAEAFRRSLDLDPAGSAYAALMLWLSERRQGKPTVLPPPASAAPPWLALLQRFLRGEVGEDDLFLAAQNLTPVEDRDGRLCEAHFFSGSLLLLHGEPRAARHAFQEAEAVDLPAFAEHTLARAELQRLELPPEKPARPRRR